MDTQSPMLVILAELIRAHYNNPQTTQRIDIYGDGYHIYCK